MGVGDIQSSAWDMGTGSGSAIPVPSVCWSLLLSRDAAPWQGILQGEAEPRGIGAFLFMNVFYFEMKGKSVPVQQW